MSKRSLQLASSGSPTARLLCVEVGVGQWCEVLESTLKPASLAVDSDGNLLIVDSRNHKLFRWRVDLANLETIAGTGYPGYAGDGGLAKNARLKFPHGVAVNRAGDIFIADYANCRIRRINNRTQIITTYAGTGECDSKGDRGSATSAALNYPSSLAIDASDSLYFVEGATQRVRRITSNGIITTYVGTGRRGFSGDGGPAKKATLNNPSGVALDDSATFSSPST